MECFNLQVTVYSKPSCVQCDATYRLMDKRGIKYDPIDITQDPDAMRFALSLGYQAAPVVVAGDKHWAGYRPDHINSLAQELNL